MIPNVEKGGQHCLAEKALSEFLLGITSKHKGDF